MLQYKLVLLLVFMNYFYLQAQINDSLEVKNPKVIILGIKKFNNLVFLTLKNRPVNTTNDEELFVVTEKENIQSFPYNEDNFKYAIFDSICYVIPDGYPGFQYYYILPYLPEKYLPILLKTYPKRYLYAGTITGVEDGQVEYYKNYRYMDIKHQKYLVALVNICLYNQYRDNIDVDGIDIAPHLYRFRGDKAEQGMYIKVLIPLIDE